jgi:predicted AlkP superfamily pyrophosphatase or phosphodiesterase
MSILQIIQLISHRNLITMRFVSFSRLFAVFTLLVCIGCSQASKQPAPVLLISIDGLRPDYLSRTDTPVLDQLIANGTLAEHLIPIFPTKTFPNHYTTVTGLYAEHTGIVSNSMMDAELGRFSMGNRQAVSDARWWGGEPIWVTAEKQGVRAGTLFWPGSEAPVGGLYATHWLEYDDDLPHDARVDTLISWFQATSDRPLQFATFYMSQVDSYGHWYGPDSDSVAVALKEVDRTLGYLISELERIGVWPHVNVIITSDHGMTEVSNDRVILIDEIISLDDVIVHDWSPVAMIQPNSGKTQHVYASLKAAEDNYSVYLKDELPDRYRLKNHSRVPEIVVVADIGYTITTRDRFEARGVSGGAHGYDPMEPDMNAFFMASGPAFKSGIVIEAFESVHIYELMCALLGLDSAPNDGDLSIMAPILR